MMEIVEIARLRELSRQTSRAKLEEHVNHCQMCRCTRWRCDDGQYLLRVLSIAEVKRWEAVFVPLDVS